MKRIEIKRILEFDADVFIIPEKISTVAEKSQDEFSYLNKISLMNGCGSLDHKEPLLQLCFTSKDLLSDNLSDNGGSCLDVDGTEIKIYPKIGYLPISLFYDVREGDNILIRIPYIHESEEIELNMSVNINQNSNNISSRYRRFGNFEEVLRMLNTDYAKRKYAITSCEAMYMEN